MMRKLLACLLLLVPSIAFGQVDIAPEDRVFNESGHQCVWCSLETMGRHWHMKSLYTLTQEHKSEAGAQEANSVLSEKGLRHWYWGKDHELQSLKNAIYWHWPVSFGWNSVHMLLLVDITKEKVKVIDNGGSEALKEQEWPISYFNEGWDGWWICIPPDAMEKRYED